MASSSSSAYRDFISPADTGYLDAHFTDLLDDADSGPRRKKTRTGDQVGLVVQDSQGVAGPHAGMGSIPVNRTGLDSDVAVVIAACPRKELIVIDDDDAHIASMGD